MNKASREIFRSVLRHWHGKILPLSSFQDLDTTKTTLVISDLNELLQWKRLNESKQHSGYGKVSLILNLSGLNENSMEELKEGFPMVFEHILLVLPAAKPDVFYADDILEEFSLSSGIEIVLPLLDPDSCSGWDDASIFHTEQLYAKLSATPHFDFNSRAYYFRVANWLGEVLSSRIKGIKSPEFFVKHKYDKEALLDALNEHWKHAGKWTFINKMLRRKITNRKIQSHGLPLNFVFHHAVTEPKNWKRILITGWYGTETAGDKAILGEIVHYFKCHIEDVEIAIATVNRTISSQTALEIDILCDIPLIDLYKVRTSGAFNSYDAVVFGGGPIMDSGTLLEIREIFSDFNNAMKGRVIFGCGVGPLRNSVYRDAAADIIRLTTHGFFRDSESADLARAISGQNRFSYACDPALAFVIRWRKAHQRRETSKSILTLLRANTKEFVIEGLAKSNSSFSEELGKALNILSDERQVQLSHMNATTHGGDDRLFNRKVFNHLDDKPGNNEIIREYLSLDEVLYGIQSSEFVLAMRFHSHIFSIAMAKPFLSIDYTGNPGKVDSLMKAIDYKAYSVEWNKVSAEKLVELMEKVISSENEIVEHLNVESRKLEELLYKTYQKTFGIESKKSL